MANYIMIFFKKYIHFFIILIPLFFSIFWHSINTQIPVSDAIGWLQAASEILQPYWNDGNYLKSLYEVFTHRPWRPVIFHLFVVPFLFITDGNFIITTLLVHAFFVLLCTYTLYKIFSLFADKLISSICATIMSLSTNIMFGGIGLPLFAELAFTPFALISIYALIKSNFFTIKKYSYIFAISFFFVLAVRPIEGIMYLTISIIIFLYLGNKNSKFNLIEISKSISIVLFGILIMLLSRLVPNISKSIENLAPPLSSEIYMNLCIFTSISFILSFIIFLFLRKYSHTYVFKENFLVKTFILLTFLTVFYWYPYVSNLFIWVYGTSIGEVVSYYRPSDWSLHDKISWALKGSGLYVFIYLFFISILYLIFCIFKNEKFSDIGFKSKEIFCYLLGIIPIPWIIYLFTIQTSYRKVSIAMVAILLIFLIYIIQIKRLKNITMVLLISLMVTQSFSVYKQTNIDYQNTYFWGKQRSLFVSNMIGNEYPLPININPNPHNVIIDFFKKSSNQYNFNKFAIVVDETGEPADAFLLYLMSIRHSFNCNIPYVTTSEFTQSDYTKILSMGYDAYFLINPKGLKMQISEDNASKALEFSHSEYKSNSAKLAYHFQYLYSSKQLEKNGFGIIDCININKQHTGCLIIKK